MLSYPVLFLYRFRYRSSVVLLCVGVVVFSPSENIQRKRVHHTTVVYDVAHKEMNVVCVYVLTCIPPPVSALALESLGSGRRV